VIFKDGLPKWRLLLLESTRDNYICPVSVQLKYIRMADFVYNARDRLCALSLTLVYILLWIVFLTLSTDQSDSIRRFHRIIAFPRCLCEPSRPKSLLRMAIYGLSGMG
ncbi:hypothetical protein, partial [Streptococcus gordonii]|uniref:hypothetical protein n=1 Tax=Streptococcus gordonii TaxID=1302 RepID=UPI0023B0CE15